MRQRASSRREAEDPRQRSTRLQALRVREHSRRSQETTEQR